MSNTFYIEFSVETAKFRRGKVKKSCLSMTHYCERLPHNVAKTGVIDTHVSTGIEKNANAGKL